MTCIIVDMTIHHAKPDSICFLPQYQRNEISVLTIKNTDSDLKVHVLHYANELLVESDFSFKNFCKLAYINMQKQFEKLLGKKVMTCTRCREEYITRKTTFRFVFLPHNINIKEKINAFFRAWAEKGIAWDIDASSLVWTLIYHGKLANPIAR